MGHGGSSLSGRERGPHVRGSDVRDGRRLPGPTVPAGGWFTAATSSQRPHRSSQRPHGAWVAECLSLGQPLGLRRRGGSHSSIALPSGSWIRAKRPTSGESQSGSTTTSIPLARSCEQAVEVADAQVEHELLVRGPVVGPRLERREDERAPCTCHVHSSGGPVPSTARPAPISRCSRYQASAPRDLARGRRSRPLPARASWIRGRGAPRGRRRRPPSRNRRACSPGRGSPGH